MYRREATEKKPRLKAVRCHDCNALGDMSVSGREYQLPSGWLMTWVWLNPLFICGACAEKRRKRFI